MPECIVCKGHYSSISDTVCRRCHSDNAAWIEWRESEPVEKGGVEGLLSFTYPHCHIPLLIALFSLGFGLLGIGGLWEGVTLGASLLAIVIGMGLDLLVLQGVYGRRHKLREHYLLERVEVSPKKEPGKTPRLKVQSKTISTPVVLTVMVLLLACTLVQFDKVWKLSEMVGVVRVTDTPAPRPTSTPVPTSTPKKTPKHTATPTPTRKPTPPPPPGFPEKVRRAWPLISVIGYVVLSPALVYSSSMLLALEYTHRMNQKLPLPLFLQDEKLARVVRREAEILGIIKITEAQEF